MAETALAASCGLSSITEGTRIYTRFRLPPFSSNAKFADSGTAYR